MGTVCEPQRLAMYRAELGERRTLTPELEHKLAVRYRDGDREAGHVIVEACVPFVMSIALEYRRWGHPIEDIVQEGNIGLLRAVERFDPERGCRLVTYAAYWVRAQIRDYVVRGYRIVRLGASKTERRALRLYRKTRERDPEQLAALSGMSIERAAALLPLLVARDLSLDRPLEGGGSPLDRLVAIEPTPEEAVATAHECSARTEALRRVIDELPARERHIVEWRWLREEPMTLEQLGEVFGISKERVRQLEERAKKRMRERLDTLLAA